LAKIEARLVAQGCSREDIDATLALVIEARRLLDANGGLPRYRKPS
jgi:hypothetical protein